MFPSGPAEWKYPVLVAIPKPVASTQFEKLSDEEKQKHADYTKLAFIYRRRLGQNIRPTELVIEGVTDNSDSPSLWDATLLADRGAK
jgi:hypothetical protein